MSNLREVAKKSPFQSPTQAKPERQLAAASGELKSLHVKVFDMVWGGFCELYY